jgi:hypothetical protein
MSEKIYACLLRLYPAKFRQTYGQDALQVFRDRLRDETGFFRRTRLWLDILIDLAISLPRLHTNAQAALAAAPVAHSAGAPLFFILEEKSTGPGALFSGCAFTLAALGLVSFLLSQAGTLRSTSFRAVQSEFRPLNSQTAAASEVDANFTAQKFITDGIPDESATFERLFPTRNLSESTPTATKTDVNFKVQNVVGDLTPDDSATSDSLPPQVINSKAPAVATSVDRAALDPQRQRVVDAVVANVKQHYFDPAIAQQTADVLIAHERRGDDARATEGKDFAALLTTQMRDVSHDMHFEVVYNQAPQPSPEEFSRMLTALQRDNCSFKKVQILPHNIGYLKLDAFLHPSVCGPTATAAMASLNHADALIFDLRDNRGGTAEMVSLLSSYLFDHPEYLFDPRRVPTSQSWTSSPVPGSEVANKPVFILTSSTTVSAAEQFTYDLKMLKRATIVGETTAGGANAGVWHQIDDHYGVAIPENRAVNPYSPFDWEATGVQPDVKVPAASALQAALRQAQSRLLKK